jgi:hypothetical protein
VGNTSDTSTVDEEENQPPTPETQDTVTLGHILTNVVILYEFIHELTALIQVRGTVFEEAGF